MQAESFEKVVFMLSNRRPFHPFVIELKGGQRFEVDHPQALALRDGVAAYFAPGGVPYLFDNDSVTTVIADTAEAAS